MKMYEVSQEVKKHLVMYTEKAGPILLADVNDIFIYVWIDFVEFFDNVDQADAAQRDVDKFVRFWKSKGKKLYYEEV